MTMPPDQHLDDDTLNLYLDAALPPAATAAARAHLDACAPCTARTTRLTTLFDALAALPAAPLTRDLAPAVRAALRRTPAPLPRAARWVFAAQALAALLLLALAAQSTTWLWAPTTPDVLSAPAHALWTQATALATALASPAVSGTLAALLTWPHFAPPSLFASALPTWLNASVVALVALWLFSTARLLAPTPPSLAKDA